MDRARPPSAPGLPRPAGLAAAVAVAEVAGGASAIKWPNDVLLPASTGKPAGTAGGRKVAGILVEGRPREGWMVLGIGLNVAVRPDEFPPELRDTAGTLGLEPADVEPVLAALLCGLERWLAAPPAAVLSAFRARDALAGREVAWADGRGRAAGVDDEGHLLVESAGGRVALDAGEVHLTRRA